MEKQDYQEEKKIILFVAVPDCVTCRERIVDLLKDMNCWERVEICYPSDYGTQIWLYGKKGDEKIDYWEKAKEAKKILEGYHYRIM